MIYRNDLFKLKCSTPGCKHNGEFIHPKCHMNKGALDLELSEQNVLHLTCSICSRHVVSIPIKNIKLMSSNIPLEVGKKYIQSCHPGTTLEISIDINEGMLKVGCIGCEKTLWMAEILSVEDFNSIILRG